MPKTIEQLEAELAEVREKNAQLEARITEKNASIHGLTQKVKKLSEMTDQEREALTEQERNIMAQQEELARRQEEFEKQQTEARNRDITERRNSIFDKYTKGDEVMRKKLEDEAKGFVGYQEAETEADIDALVSKAYTLVAPVSEDDDVTDSVLSEDSYDAPATGSNGFADSARGQALAQQYGLSFAKTPKTDVVGEPEDNE